MSAIRKVIRSKRAQALVELTLMIPMLIALGLGVVEVGNMINSYLVMTHLTREARTCFAPTGKQGEHAVVNQYQQWHEPGDNRCQPGHQFSRNGAHRSGPV